jgi:hypothetical protein
MDGIIIVVATVDPLLCLLLKNHRLLEIQPPLWLQCAPFFSVSPFGASSLLLYHFFFHRRFFRTTDDLYSDLIRRTQGNSLLLAILVCKD